METQSHDKAIALDEDELMEVDEVAAKLRITPHRTKVLLRTGALPGVRVGKKWMVSKAALAAWIVRGGCAPPSQRPVGKRGGRKPARKGE